MITIPTLQQLSNSILSDLQASYGSSIPSFTKSILRAISYVQAAKLKLYYLAIANLQKNIFVDTADPVASGGTLERFGFIKLGRYPFPAQAAQYIVSITGTAGAVVAARTTFKSNDSSSNPGILFTLDNPYTLTASTGQLTLRALVAGEVSKLVNGDLLTATAPIAGVDSEATVINTFIPPLDAEDIEVYRNKAIEAYRLEPQGGAATDYRLWSFDAQGVQNTYPYAKSGAANEVDLYVEATLADSSDGKGSAGAAMLSAVQDVVEFNPDTSLPLNERGRRPLAVFAVNYLSVTPLNVDVIITGYVNLTPAIQTIILSAITTYVNTVRPFVAGADILADRNDTLSTNNLITVVLNAVPGSVFTSITLQVAGVNYASYQFVFGNISYLNSVTYN